MDLLSTLRIALRSLRTNTLRSALTMLGIIIGVAAVIAMIGVGKGAQTRVEEQVRSLGANVMVLWPSSTVAECLPVYLWRRPRELPVEAGQTLVGLELKRLGIKAAW